MEYPEGDMHAAFLVPAPDPDGSSEGEGFLLEGIGNE